MHFSRFTRLARWSRIYKGIRSSKRRLQRIWKDRSRMHYWLDDYEEGMCEVVQEKEIEADKRRDEVNE